MRVCTVFAGVEGPMAHHHVSICKQSGHVQAVIDGYEDWFSATGVVEEIVDALEASDLRRVQLDFRTAQLGIHPGDAVEIANFFTSVTELKLEVTIYPPASERGRQVITAFASPMLLAGHSVQTRVWTDNPSADDQAGESWRATA